MVRIQASTTPSFSDGGPLVRSLPRATRAMPVKSSKTQSARQLHTLTAARMGRAFLVTLFEGRTSGFLLRVAVEQRYRSLSFGAVAERRED